MNFQETLKKGVQLVAFNSHEELHGTVIHYDADQNIIELENVYDNKSNYNYDSAIVINVFNYNLKICKEIEREAVPTTQSYSSSNNIVPDSYQETDGNIEPTADLEDLNYFQITKPELDVLNKILNTEKFIDCKDESYYEAIKYLQQETVVSLVLETEDGNDCKNIKHLCLASWNKVFIFENCRVDLLNGTLRDILKNKDINKIVYSSSIIVYLKETLNIELGKTIVLADFLNLSSQNETGLNNVEFYKPLYKYLRLIETFTTPDGEKNINSLKIKEIAVYQLKVFDIILKNLFKDFYSRSKSFSLALSNKSYFKAASVGLRTSQPAMEIIDPLNENWKRI